MGQSGPFANGDTFALSRREQGFREIGTALQCGDISSAAQALQQLQQSFKPRAATSPDVPANAPTSALSTIAGGSATSAPGGPEIVLNLGNLPAGEQIAIGLSGGTNGTEQISISAANAQGQADGHIQLNLSQNANEQIVLNLFNTSTNPSALASNVNVSA